MSLDKLDLDQLQGLSRVAGRLLAGRPLFATGHRPHHCRAGQGVEFFDFRDYQPGDDPRGIDWRASARSPRPQIRRHYDERASDWFICLDRSASMATQAGGKWHQAVRLAAAFAYLLLDLDHRVGLVLFSDQADSFAHPGRGRGGFARLLGLLENNPPDQTGGASRLEQCVPLIPHGAEVLVISDFLADDDMAAALRQLALNADQLYALAVWDSQDLRLPESDWLELVDAESGQTRPVKPGPEANARARQADQARRRRLADYCRGQRIAFGDYPVDLAWQQVLLRYLRGLGTNA